MHPARLPSTISILTISFSDQSIFAPSATNIQTGFRRAELIPASNNGTDPSTTGVQTLHFSLMKDAKRPLNLSHEYQMVRYFVPVWSDCEIYDLKYYPSLLSV